MKETILFCLPYAGGSARIYAKWRKFLNSSVELFPIELAGRGKRFNEPFYSTMDEAIHDIYSQIKDKLNHPFAIYGHSMGSLLAYELSYKIQQTNGLSPLHIFFSGGKPPHCRTVKKEIHKLTDSDFKNEIKRMGGTPNELLAEKELFEIFMPILRADFRLIETYRYIKKSDSKLNSKVTVLNGKEDEISDNELLGWQQYTKQSCNIVNFEGGHFFINDHAESIVDLINNVVKIENKLNKSAILHIG